MRRIALVIFVLVMSRTAGAQIPGTKDRLDLEARVREFSKWTDPSMSDLKDEPAIPLDRFAAIRPEVEKLFRSGAKITVEVPKSIDWPYVEKESEKVSSGEFAKRIGKLAFTAGPHQVDATEPEFALSGDRGTVRLTKFLLDVEGLLTSVVVTYEMTWARGKSWQIQELRQTVRLPSDAERKKIDEAIAKIKLEESKTPPVIFSEPLPPDAPLGIEFVKIAPGAFQMGCSKGEKECEARDKPAHTVQITKSFELGKYEVTQGQWLAVTGKSPLFYEKDDLPVVSMTWFETQDFIKRLNGRNDGYHYRLPTEAEWEYAARAGTATANTGQLDSMAWYQKNSRGVIHPVGTKKPNEWGFMTCSAMFQNGARTGQAIPMLKDRRRTQEDRIRASTRFLVADPSKTSLI